MLQRTNSFLPSIDWGKPSTVVRTGFSALVVSSILSACGSSDLDGEPELAAANGSIPDSLNDAAGLNDLFSPNEIEESSRQLTVYLQLDSASSFQPVYADRVVVAQPVVPKIAKKAEGRMLVQGIQTVVVGSSCESLVQRYPEITECAVVDSMEVAYGYIQATATTDQEGFASLAAVQGDVRVSVRSWPTVEDDKCHWSGSAIAKSNVDSVAVPLLVFCE